MVEQQNAQIPSKRAAAHHVTTQVAASAPLKDGGQGQATSITTVYGTTYRVSLMGIVVLTNSGVVSLDDGSGPVECRAFENQEHVQSFQVGTPVQIVGRPRIYNQNRYVLIEAIAGVSTDWLGVRKKEVELLGGGTVVDGPSSIAEPEPKIVTSEPMIASSNTANTAEEHPPTEINKPTQAVESVSKADGGSTSLNRPEQLIQIIQTLDTGKGCEIDAVLKQLGGEDAEKILNDLIKDGEVYEIRSGIIKVL